MTPAPSVSAPRPLVAVGKVGLWGTLALALAATIALALQSPAYGLVVPGLVLGAATAIALSRVPLGHLLGVMAFFGVTARAKEGIQVEEVVFAGYYLTYLVAWFGARVWVYREPVVRTSVDVCVALFLAYMTASLGLTFLFGGDLSAARSDWINFSMLAFYFPIKEATARYRWGPWIVVGVVLYLGLFSFVRNLVLLSSALSGAEYAWQVARGRVPMNEMLLLVPALGCLGFAIRERFGRRLVVYAGGFALFAVGVILTQWRAYYIDLAFGVGLFFLLVGWRPRGRLSVIVVVGGALGLGFGYLVFGDLATLLIMGIVDRALSIGTATSVDVSLLNRFLETASVWEEIQRNPIVGYGLGTSFSFFDTIFDATWTKPYAHNGFLTLWFKFGVVGLGLIVWTWGASIATAYRGWKHDVTNVDGAERTLLLALAVTLVALVPSHFISATFSTSDTVMMFAILTGTVAGLRLRHAPAER